MRNSDIKLRAQIIKNADVSVETNVHSVEVILSGSILCIQVTERKVIHTHIITTLYVDAVVLCHSIVINLVRPVCIIMIYIIIVAIGIVIEEAEVYLLLLNAVNCTNHLSSIAAIL